MLSISIRQVMHDIFRLVKRNMTEKLELNAKPKVQSEFLVKLLSMQRMRCIL